MIRLSLRLIKKIWKIGERSLPSERDLAEKFQVSRRLATLLVEEGVLERREAPFITSARVQEKCDSTTSFTEIM